MQARLSASLGAESASTTTIEDKWETRFAEQLDEHERALAQERERSFETLRDKTEELKAIRKMDMDLYENWSRSGMSLELSEKTKLSAALEMKIADREAISRKLHNTVQELRGNVRIHFDTFAYMITTNVGNPHTFKFDKIYSQFDSQEFVFQDVSDFIQSAVNGYNVCIFAHSQAVSGKTHTMQRSGAKFSLIVTSYEINNGAIRDLLTVKSDSDVKHCIRTDYRDRNYVEGLNEVDIDFDRAAKQVDEIMNLTARNRSVDRIDMNAHSPRVAASERLSRSNATGDRLKEAQAINKSLSALAGVFQALAKKSAHVSYRNSKFTFALQPALSGEGKSLMMANPSPTYASLDESLSSLRFAQKVSQCVLGTPVRQIK
ncbi:Kinesin-like protein [Phytophthora cactorum]|nr:Kinesin-like protein [Phytophthora cactorum]